MASAVDKQPAAARLAAVAAAGCLPTAANESQSSCTTCGDTTQDDAHDEDTVMALARKHRLSAYDAAYLETALRRGDRLATLDRDLANAASAEGVALIH